MRLLQRLAISLIALAVVFATHLISQIASTQAIEPSHHSVNTPVDLSQMTLVFSDEFSEATLDRDRWVTEFWNGVRTNAGNQEAQYYVPDAFEFIDDTLRIRADEKSIAGFDYTSGLISTRESFIFQNGYMELRARVPKGKGLWPAFWLLQPGPWPPEIDVLEVLGDKTDQVHMSLHYQDEQGQASHDMGTYQGADFSKDFHTFAAQWKPTEIIWYIDGVERYRLQENIPQVPMYLLINLAVGGTWPGYPDRSTPFPSYFDVDYVRVYQSESERGLGEG